MLDEAEVWGGVGWESEGGQNWHEILPSRAGDRGIAARVPEIGLYSWPELQKDSHTAGVT